MTRSMAIEMARYGIRVNAIAPGYFETEINDEFLNSDLGHEHEKAHPYAALSANTKNCLAHYCLLASDAGSFMTGSTIVVDGGHVWG